MTHIVRDLDKLGSKMHKKEIVETVTLLEAPPVVVIGVVGYKETPKGLRTVRTVWAQHIADEARRRFTGRWYKSKKLAFTKTAKKYTTSKNSIARALTIIKNRSTVVRAIVHTQISKVKIGQKKAHVAEIQINGGNVVQKVNFVVNLFEKSVSAASVFAENEHIDVIGSTKGKGFKGVVSRWGVKKLPRKTHKGLRKVACIGAWHPARVSWAVPRAGQKGYHHRVEVNKKIYRVGKGMRDEKGKLTHTNGTTEFDITPKSINPMGGFPFYGHIYEDYIMLKGSVMGPAKRVITLRKTLRPQTSRAALEQVSLKFIDTSSKFGHGKFQTSEEKAKFLGPLKPKKSRPTASKK